MPLSPLIDRLAFLPAAELTETLSVFRAALAPLGADLLLNQRIDRELTGLTVGNTRISPQLVTHLFEWTGPLESFGASQASADPEFAARWRRLTESPSPSVTPIFSMAPRRQGRELSGPGATPLISRMRELFDAKPRLSDWPGLLIAEGLHIAPGDRRGLAAALRELFGRDVPVDDFLNAFRVDVPGYRLRMLCVEKDLMRVLITGRLAAENGEDAGAFQRAVGLPPPSGGEWRALASGYNPAGGFDPHSRRGLARGMHQRFLTFLHRLGADRFYLSSDKSGNYVWPHLGFRHVDSKQTQNLKSILRDYLEIRSLWTPEAEESWRRIGESWDIADFAVDGSNVGRDFLLSLEGKLGQNLYFDVADLTDAGWKRLFKDV